ncbi:GtrA family protein [Rhizobium sp. PDO1-076]|uniref:GtrA family protein n=1 Tax=Rhizobium sp. PDO1-076 TaxID=1125979 RepID=UPI00024E2F27|nr:GtrA family protein [Rhizobium sp. PDO1-076]EHS50344.1 GtrA family protein [Rhizobium sp. PDO1-076]
MKKFIRFVIVGATGFLVDAGTLWLLLTFSPLGPLSARVIAIALAMTATWLLNRTFTFGASKRSVVVEGFRYGVIAVITSLINYGIYAGLLIMAPLLSPYAALVFASIAAMLFSFFGYSRFVFRR